jgi:hypothetical protein
MKMKEQLEIVLYIRDLFRHGPLWWFEWQRSREEKRAKAEYQKIMEELDDPLVESQSTNEAINPRLIPGNCFHCGRPGGDCPECIGLANRAEAEYWDNRREIEAFHEACDHNTHDPSTEEWLIECLNCGCDDRYCDCGLDK